MRTYSTRREVKDLLMAGYEHYSREEERLLLDAFLLKEEIPDLNGFPADRFFLAQQPLRSAKNLIICLVAIVCRYAADHGANDRRCYALSDTYINKIEDQENVEQVYGLVLELLLDYRHLIQESREEVYSRPIQQAIRLIDTHLYEPCSLSLIAQKLKLHPAYLSKLFKEEVGKNITGFIHERKMEEAQNLMLNTQHSLSEIAEMLGYSSLSYFSKVFQKTKQVSPSQFVLKSSGLIREAPARK